MKFSISYFLVTLIFLSYSSAIAQVEQLENQLKKDPENVTVLLQLGTYYHDLAGRKKNKPAVKEAAKYLEKILSLQSEHCLAKVYYGSVLTMKAREAFFPWKKRGYMREGFRAMDAAVRMCNDQPQVRLIRAINNTTVPLSFSRLPIALADFEFIIHSDSQVVSTLNSDFWAPFYYYYGVALLKNKQDEKAKGMWKQVSTLYPDSPYTKKANEQLKILEEHTYVN